MSGWCSEVKMRSDAACVLPRRLPPSQPRPPQEQHFTTRAQHLEDVQNMSGSARCSEPLDSCRETPDTLLRPSCKKKKKKKDTYSDLSVFNEILERQATRGCWFSTKVCISKQIEPQMRYKVDDGVFRLGVLSLHGCPNGLLHITSRFHKKQNKTNKSPK